MRMLHTTIVTIALMLSMFPAPAFAQQCLPDGKTPTTECKQRALAGTFIRNPSCKCCGDCQLNDFVGLGVEASRYIFGITGSLALIMFAVGGFWWLTAAGTPDRIEKGKNTLVAAVIGIIIIFGAWVLVNSLLAALTGQLGAGPVKILGGEWWKTPR